LYVYIRFEIRCEDYDAKETKALERSTKGEIDDEWDDGPSRRGASGTSGAKRKSATMGSISGADGSLYAEFDG
jgi:hypothetical protein